MRGLLMLEWTHAVQRVYFMLGKSPVG